MLNLNNYIVEKLKIGKDTKIPSNKDLTIVHNGKLYNVEFPFTISMNNAYREECTHYEKEINSYNQDVYKFYDENNIMVFTCIDKTLEPLFIDHERRFCSTKYGYKFITIINK